MLNFSKIRIPFFDQNDKNFNLQKYGLRHFLDVCIFCTTSIFWIFSNYFGFFIFLAKPEDEQQNKNIKNEQ